MVPAATVHASIANLCDARERRFLYDLIEEVNPDPVYACPVLELYAWLLALEHMWGGAEAKHLTVPSGLMYYLVIYATHAHDTPKDKDIEGWRRGSAFYVHEILQGFMESVTVAIQDGSLVKHKDDGAYIDLFRIPQWFYEEVHSRTGLRPLRPPGRRR
jgi:hypothetical protein